MTGAGANTGVRARRAATLIQRHDDGDQDAIQFLQAGSRVHVVTTEDNRSAARLAELLGEDDQTSARMRFITGETWTICGLRFVRHRNGFESNAQLVSHFPDDLLCWTCHEAFGDRGAIIFEVNQPDGSDPTQAGQLTSDLVHRGGPGLR